MLTFFMDKKYIYFPMSQINAIPLRRSNIDTDVAST